MAAIPSATSELSIEFRSFHDGQRERNREGNTETCLVLLMKIGSIVTEEGWQCAVYGEQVHADRGRDHEEGEQRGSREGDPRFPSLPLICAECNGPPRCTI